MARHGYASLDVEHRSRIEHWLTGLAHTLLKHGSYVILESGFWAMADRERHYRIAAAAGADVELHYLDAPLDELARRLSLRNARPEPGGYTVPVERLTVWANEFEPPAPDELARFAPPIRTLCAAAPGRGPAPT
jgi:predicted kinase